MTDVLSTPERRIEGRDKVTGTAAYAADIRREGMLHAAFVGSPYPHARIVRVDTTAARAVAGVRAVLVGSDVRPARFGRRLQDWPVLAWDRVRFIGDRVAAVAADTLVAAEEAARLIDVTYEELPAVLSAADALRPGAENIHPDRAEETMLGAERPAHPPNVQGRVTHEHGDVDGGFARAAHVFEHTFQIARVHQGYIEPRAALVWLDGDVVHVVSTNKAPFSLRDQLMATFDLPAEKVIVRTPHVGGDFGGKGLSIDEFALVFLARATGRPVRALMRYADELQVSNTRHGGTIRLRTGFDAEGRITAHEAHALFDGGAYAAGKPGPSLIPGDSMMTLAGYHVPAARVESVCVYTNQLPAGNARSPGQPQVNFAAESHLDIAAREMGIDPLALRERNAIKPGEMDVTGSEWHTSELARVLETLRREMHWEQRPSNGRGRGVSLGARHVGRGTTTLALTMARDSEVLVRTAVTDQGGGAHTMIQRVVAQELGVGPEAVRVEQLDTGASPRDPGVGGSRVTAVHGNAALDGARKLKLARERGDPLPITVTGSAEQSAHEFAVYAYGIEVEVDRDTGGSRITDALLVADVGTVINPVALRGQLEGAFAYGLGQAVMEELVVQDGRVITASLGDYKLPTIADVPPLRIVLLTEAKGPGPFGAKSVGELANPGVPAAVANAIADACGARVLSLPVTAEKVFAALARPAARQADAVSAP